MASLDSFKCRNILNVGAKTYHYFSLKAAERNGLAGISALPISMKVNGILELSAWNGSNLPFQKNQDVPRFCSRRSRVQVPDPEPALTAAQQRQSKAA